MCIIIYMTSYNNYINHLLNLLSFLYYGLGYECGCLSQEYNKIFSLVQKTKTMRSKN